jgi:hypothetical protein
MRFVPDGPDIPNYLIKEWRNGEVLFLAGAGVSAPSKLPLFEGLALEVYKSLNDSLFGVLIQAKKRRRAFGREKVLAGANLSPEKRVEANLFFERQYDRLFSALEKRIDPDLRGRPKTRKVREAVETILGGKTYSPSHYDLLRLSLAPNSSGDRSKRSSCRIATTNFDLLFEAAWQKQFSSDPISFDARMAPRPGAHNFDGIIHLHGSLTDDPSLLGNYVLSSRDFARVYLRSGVIGNYVYDLIRRYRVVLVGYSADDPPMRYLMDAIGEDASLFEDMKKPIAITDLSTAPEDPSGAIEEAVWLAKEIMPIFYKRAAGKAPYDPLWRSIHEWADWSREEAAWVERQLEENTRMKRADASPFQRALVQDLLAVLNPDELEKAVVFLSGKKVDFSWIETVSAAIDPATQSRPGH